MRSRVRSGFLLLLGLSLAGCMGARLTGGGAGALAGTAWTLVEVNGEAASISGPGDSAPTLTFAADGSRASGNGGCNQFGGPYTQSGPELRFGPLVSTRRACADEAGNRQETAYLRALESTTRATAAGDLLVLYAGDAVVARLRRSDG